MRVYTVHLRRHGLDPDRDIVLVKEGFSWPAALFSVLWALWSRMWWVAAALLTIELAVSGALAWTAAGPVVEAAVSLGLALIVGFVANDLKRWSLERDNFTEAAVVAARDEDSALRRIYDHPQAIPGLTP